MYKPTLCPDFQFSSSLTVVVQTGLDFCIEIKVWVSLAHIIKSCSILVTTLFFKLVCLLVNYVEVISWVEQDGLKDSVVTEEVWLATPLPGNPPFGEALAQLNVTCRVDLWLTFQFSVSPFMFASMYISVCGKYESNRWRLILCFRPRLTDT